VRHNHRGCRSRCLTTSLDRVASPWDRAVAGKVAALLVGLALFSSHPARSENWPQWRGPEGTGISRERGIPLIWNAQRSIVWKAQLQRWGNSTPAIWEFLGFLTTHTDDGRLLLEARRLDTGQLLWQKQVGQGVAPRQAAPRTTQKFHRLHNLASPSPVTDGSTVVAHFGNGDLAAYTLDGRQLWKRNLQEDYGEYTIWWGHANSPVIYRDLVISVCMQDSLERLRPIPAKSYLVAHDLKTGEVRWFTSRVTEATAEECDSYTTPLIVQRDDHDELLVMGGNRLDAYAPSNGKLLWWLPGLKGGRTITGPTVGENMIFTTIGMRGFLLGIDYPQTPGKQSRSLIRWEARHGTPDSCSPVLWKDWLFVISDQGVARCYDVKRGRVEWSKRLKGNYKASPVFADGHIFFLNTEGLCTVVTAGPVFSKVAENSLPDTTLASPAISNRRIYIRGHRYLWSIGRK